MKRWLVFAATGCFACAAQSTSASTSGSGSNSGTASAGTATAGTATAGVGQDGCFTVGKVYTLHGFPTSIVAADLNGDGKLDLAISNENPLFDAGSASVLLGGGDGTFAPEVLYAAGVQPAAVVAADFDGDGKLDLAVSNFGDETVGIYGTVGIYRGAGDGTFAAPQPFETHGAPGSMVAGDLNGDGHPDLVMTSGNGGIGVMLNTGGSFSASTYYDIGFDPTSIALGDLDGNGSLDLAVTTYGDPAPPGSNTPVGVNILLNQGSGTFASPVNYDTGGLGPSAVAIGSFSSGGMPSLAIGNFYKELGSMSVLPNVGQGDFGLACPYPADLPSDIAVADFDGDGRADIVVLNSGASVSLFLNHGGGTFKPRLGTTPTYGSSPTAMAVGDFNGDGLPDIAVTEGYFSRLTILLNGCGSR